MLLDRRLLALRPSRAWVGAGPMTSPKAAKERVSLLTGSLVPVADAKSGPV
jgi:hypothetical protein